MVTLFRDPNRNKDIDVIEIDPLVGGGGNNLDNNKSKIEKKENRTLENWLDMEPIGSDYAGNEDEFFDALGDDTGNLPELEEEDNSEYSAKTEQAESSTKTVPDFQPNVLNNFDVPTYNFTLYFCHPVIADKKLHRKQGTIIAESGVTTRFHIDNVEIQTIVGGDTEVKAEAPVITFQITEPNGAGMMPALIKLCNDLDIPSFTRAGFVLELEFKGRHPVTSEPITLQNSTWTYQLTVMDITTDHNMEGSKYLFSTIATNNTALQPEFEKLDVPITINGVKTLGEAVSQLERKLNIYHKEKAESQSSTVYDKVTIKIPKAWEQWQCILDEGPSETTYKIGNRDFTFDPGSSIKDHLASLVFYTKQMQDNYTAARADNEIAGRTKDKQPSKYFIDAYKVKHDVTHSPNFDLNREKFGQHITYTVIPTLDFPVMKQSRYIDIVEDRKKQDEIISLMAGQKLLKKRYDYLNTGLNTEVIRFEHTINQAHIIPEAIYGGTTSYPLHDQSARATDPAVTDKDGKIGEKTTDQLKADLGTYNKEVTSETARLSKLDQDVDKLLEQGYSIFDIGEKRNEIQEKIANAEKNANAISAQLQQRILQRSNDLTYLGDTVESVENTLRHRYLPTKLSQNSSISGNAIREFARQKQKNSQTTAMMSIDITVRGDPYWLGPPTDYAKGGRITEDNYFDIDAGPPYFLFSMFFPRNYEEETGLATPYFNPIFSGVYQVLNIVHNFNGGQYTCFLPTCLREMSLTDQLIKDLVDATDDDPYTQPDATEIETEADDTTTTESGDVEPAPQPPGTLLERQIAAVDYYIAQGLTKEAAIAMAAHQTRESNFNNNITNPGDASDGTDSQGLSQWNQNRRTDLIAYAQAKEGANYDPVNAPLGSIETQMGYTVHEFNGPAGVNGGSSESAYFNDLQNSDNVTEAVINSSKSIRYGKGEDNYNNGLNSPETQKRVAIAKTLEQNYNEYLQSKGNKQ